MTPAEIGKKVRAQRKAAGLTQARAAGLCNVGIRFLSDIENGKPTAALGKVLQVLDGLGLLLAISSRDQRAGAGK